MSVINRIVCNNCPKHCWGVHGIGGVCNRCEPEQVRLDPNKTWIRSEMCAPQKRLSYGKGFLFFLDPKGYFGQDPEFKPCVVAASYDKERDTFYEIGSLKPINEAEIKEWMFYEEEKK